MIENFSVN